jgi:hypothetical protein
MKNQRINAAIYFAGVFLAGFLLFFGLAVALFMMVFQVKSVNYVRFEGGHRLLLRYGITSKLGKSSLNDGSGSAVDINC